MNQCCWRNGVIPNCLVSGAPKSVAGTQYLTSVFWQTPASRELSPTEDLFPFGLNIDNINVEEIKDKPGNKFFENLKQTELAVVDNQRTREHCRCAIRLGVSNDDLHRPSGLEGARRGGRLLGAEWSVHHHHLP